MKYLLISLALLAFNAQASYIDLSGGDIVAQSKCNYNKKEMYCLLVEHKELLFVVLLDEKGEYQIYLIEEEATTLIWSRNSI